MTNIEWENMPHGVFKATLQAGLEERDRRVQEMLELTGTAPAQPERRGPGRPPGTRPSTRAEQLAAAAAEDRGGEVVQ